MPQEISWKRLSRVTAILCLGLDHDSLDFVERDFLLATVVEAGGPRRFVAGHVFGLLKRATILEIRRNACRPKRVTADVGRDSRGPGVAFDKLPYVKPGHRLAREDSMRLLIEAAKEETPAIFADSGGIDVRVEVGLQIVMTRHFDDFSVFLVQPQPPAFALEEEILNFEGHHGADAGERIAHGSQNRSVAEADQGAGVDGIEKLAGLLSIEDRRLAAPGRVFWTADGMGWVHVDNVAGDHPIEKHSDCCKGLLDRRFGMLPAEFFDVACDRHGFESVEAKAPVVTPIGKLADGAKVGRPRVRVSDVDREKLDEPASCIGSCVRNECRNGTSSLGQQGNRMAKSDDTVSHLDFRMEIRLREECSTPRTDRGRESGSYRTK